TLLLYCLKPLTTAIGIGNVLIEGGESVTGITAAWVLPASAATAPPNTATSAELAYFNSLQNPNVLVVRTSAAGDFSPYTLRLVNDAPGAAQDTFEVTEVLTGFDPQLSAVTFSFKIECGPDFDCAPPKPDCPPAAVTPPPINYLAKDYGSFRTVLLDRLNQLLPAWGLKSEADMGVVLAELLAYAGDQLSYHQDAVTTEAYLLTARSRISLRRHARLVDYRVHDGCNARAWIRLTVATAVNLDRASARFYTFAPGMPSSLAIGSGNEQAALDAGVVVFEPLQNASLFPAHNVMALYTWGDTDCCLPAGATEATLAGYFPNLQVGDVLVLQEIMGPQTGMAADADIRHRYAVRLTSVATTDARGVRLVDPLFEEGTGAPIVSAGQMPAPVTEIQWSPEDALAAPLCISSTFRNSDDQLTNLTGVSVAYGNVVLADQGLSMPPTPLPTVPGPTLFVPGSATATRCSPQAATPFPVRYRPKLAQRPVTQAAPVPLGGSPVTPNAVPLVANGYVNLVDGSGVTTLMVAPDSPLSWPQYFGVVVTVNTPPSPALRSFTLSVVYQPTAAASAVTLETFSDLTVASGAVGNALTQINGVSKFIRVSSPGGNDPSQVPLATAMLSLSGPTALKDTVGTTYLQVAPTNALSWPPLFSVLAQGSLTDPTKFNLLLLYAPPDGGVGVPVPVVVEQFADLSLDTIASAFAPASTLLDALTFEEQPAANLSAFELTHYDPGAATPAIRLTGTVGSATEEWTVAPDLLASGPEDPNFVVEVEYDGAASLRFGDDVNGKRPVSGTAFRSSYRIGNGTAGNVGADSLVWFAGDPRIVKCTNPLPAAGGVDPETMAQIRRRAPQAFLTQERAVTMTDYADVTKRNPGVEDAAATLRWTGSWYTTFITAEPVHGAKLGKSLRRALTRSVNRYRLAGQDIQLEGPDYVSLEIQLTVCVEPEYFQADVQQSLLEVLGSGSLPNGEPALFAPGSFKLGQTVYLSPIYAAARTVAGVKSVTADVFQPVGVPTSVFLEKGEIPLGAFQVARMDNDRSRPANGQLTLSMCGGK
ncbi:MAG TPA: putative baseplate assembly protein, partial [Polyangiaceae bacterium]